MNNRLDPGSTNWSSSPSGIRTRLATSCTHPSLPPLLHSLSLSPSISVSAFCFHSLCFPSSFFVSVRLSSSGSVFPSLRAAPSLPLSITPSPLLLATLSLSLSLSLFVSIGSDLSENRHKGRPHRARLRHLRRCAGGIKVASDDRG